MLSFERFTHSGMYLRTEYMEWRHFESQRIHYTHTHTMYSNIAENCYIYGYMPYRSPFHLFSWHNAQARSVTSQCSGLLSSLFSSFHFSLSPVHVECKDRRRCVFRKLHTPFYLSYRRSLPIRPFDAIFSFLHIRSIRINIFFSSAFFLACFAVYVAANFC